MASSDDMMPPRISLRRPTIHGVGVGSLGATGSLVGLGAICSPGAPGTAGTLVALLIATPRSIGALYRGPVQGCTDTLPRNTPAQGADCHFSSSEPSPVLRRGRLLFQVPGR